ncbi:MAG TPA: hypothetical protein VLV87_10260 [Gammaproteobacteria bacterium]|nr:hypothetical protein [Gammaproteobacteria bacterium]
MCVQGLSTAFTNSNIEAGIIHCRALLEFLGLRCDPRDPSKLIARSGKRDDDFVIEDFVGPAGPLVKVTVEQAIAPYAGPKDEAEKAFASIIHCANKGLAHMTGGHIVDLQDIGLYEIASRGVPVLVSNYFYVALGLPTPDYELAKTLRNLPDDDERG